MSNPRELLDRCHRLGLRLEPRGDMLAVIPADRVPPDFADLLRKHKRELLDWLSRAPCPGWQIVPPPDLPLNPIMPRPTPENRERVIAYLLWQGCDRPGPLTAWLVRRENTYYEGVGSKWDCSLICYAAARDAACWQLNRSEEELWDFLAASHEIARRSKSTGRREPKIAS